MHRKHAAICAFIDLHLVHLPGGKLRYSQSFPPMDSAEVILLALARAATASAQYFFDAPNAVEVACNEDERDVNEVSRARGHLSSRDQIPQHLRFGSGQCRARQVVVRAKLIRRAGRPWDRPAWRAARGCSRPARRRVGAPQRRR